MSRQWQSLYVAHSIENKTSSGAWGTERLSKTQLISLKKSGYPLKNRKSENIQDAKVVPVSEKQKDK